MDGIPGHNELERIRDANPIEDVVQEHVELTRRGNVFKGLCPFHPDKNPSMDVNPDRRTFRCWSCEEHGDVFSFVQKIEGVEFPEAKKILAERAGIEIKEWKPDPRLKQQEDQDLQLLERTAAWFERQLQSTAGAPARKYLADRGFTEDSIRKFRIGFAPPGWHNLCAELGRLGDGAAGAMERAEKLGLIKQGQRADGYYDAYRDRVIFPIHEQRRGKVVGFGGRHLGSEPSDSGDDPPKYINSRESKIYSKKQHLYGFREGRKEIGSSKRAILCEGYTDVVMAHQCGFPMAVASLGTALTREHVSFLSKKVHRIDLLFDGDEPGQRAACRSCELFLGTDVEVRVVMLSQGQDPCDLLTSEQGGERFESLLESGEDPIEFVVKQIQMEHTGDSAAATQRRMSEISSRILERFAGTSLETAAVVVARVTGHSESSLLKDHHRLVAERPSRPSPASSNRSADSPEFSEESGAVADGDLTATEDAMLVNMLLYPSQIEFLLRIRPPERWSHPIRRSLAIRFSALGAPPDSVHIEKDLEKSYYLRLQERADRERQWIGTDDAKESEFDLAHQLLIDWLIRNREQFPPQQQHLEKIMSINQAIQKLTESPESFQNVSLLNEIINTFEGKGNNRPPEPGTV